MKASVIIPAHNEEQYIAKTLTAVLAMEYQDFEVIVVDNNSTDKTAQIAATFPGVRVIFEKRKGSQFAREAGRQASSGEIIAFIDADCLPEPDWLSRCAADLAKGYVAVTGPYDYYDYNSRFGKFGLFLQTAVYYPMHQILQFFRFGGTMVLGNAAATRQALEAIGGLNTNYTFYGDDTDLVKSLTRIGRVKFDLRLVMKTSARRFRRGGIARTLFLYIYHFLYVTFIRNPYDYFWSGSLHDLTKRQ